MLSARDFAIPFSYLPIQSVFSSSLHFPSPYNVCPGHEHRITSPSRLHHPKEQGLAAVDSTGWRGHSLKQRRRSRSSNGRKNGREPGRRRRRWASVGGGNSNLESPTSKQGERSREARSRRRKKREFQSLPRDPLRNYDDSETERGKKKERERGRSREIKSRSEGRMRMGEGEEEPEQEDKQKMPAVQQRVEERAEEAEEKVNVEREEDVHLPIPSPIQKLPRPKQNLEAAYDENWDVAAEYKKLRQEQEQERSRDDDRCENKKTELNEDEKDDEVEGKRNKRLLPSVAAIEPASQRNCFSFLTPTLPVEQLGDVESESGGSDDKSDGSVSAASISGLSLPATEAGGRRAAVLPGPWPTPSQQEVAQISVGNTQPGRQTGQGRGRSTVS